MRDDVQGILEEVKVDVAVGHSGDTRGERMHIPAHQQPAASLGTVGRPENLPPSRRTSIRQFDNLTVRATPHAGEVALAGPAWNL